MKAPVFSRDKVVKIRYDNNSDLPDILAGLRKIPDMEIKERGYTG